MALECKADSDQQIEAPKDLLRDVRFGEWWLIGINALLLLAQIVVAVIYLGQLNQMRIATTASTEATRIATDALQYSSSQFDRTMTQIVSQTAAEYNASVATKSAADTAAATLTSQQASFEADQRPYVLVSSVGSFSTRDPLITTAVAQDNYGKSPAIDVIGAGDVYYGVDARVKANTWFARHNKVMPAQSGASVLVIPPFVQPDPTKPKALSFVTPKVSPSASERLFAMENNFGMVVVYRVQYRSLRMKPYWTEFCVGRLKDGTVTYCDKHNSVH